MNKCKIFLVVFLGSLLTAGAAEAQAACNGLTPTITGTAAGETISGTAGNDVIDALGGNDTILASSGNDTICAGDGYDTIVPGPGTDWIDGGVGGGVMDYTAVAAAMTVNLTTGTAVGDGTDTIINVSDVYGSTSYADFITGNSNNNYLVGWGGNDVLVGLAGADYLQGLDGNDSLEGGAGNDTYNAGNDTDTAVFTNASGAVTVNLATTTSQNTVNDGSDTITTTENLTGTGFGDTLTGSTAANVIDGAGGNDTIAGGDGADVLTGGLGADILSGENGDDTLYLNDGVTDSATASTCGAGTDTATRDVADTLGTDCETVNIPSDTTPPTASLGGFTEVTGNAYQYSSGSTVWVNPTQTGSFSVDVTATDGGSGMQRVEYPTLGTGWSPSAGNDTATPFTYVYTWSVAPAAPGAQTAVARDMANNTTNVGFTVTTDNAGPTGGSVSYLDGYTSATSVNIAVASGTDAVSGLASYQLQRRSAALTGATCGTYGSFANIGPASPTSPYADATVADNTCYQYQVIATDNVGNASTFTSAQVLKIERTAPAGLAVSNLTGNSRIDGVAVLTWTAATDSQSGLNRYEVKSWPDGAAEPADTEFRSTGSTAAFANVRIGVNPTTSPWDWKFRVRAVDNAGNATASSSVAILDDPSNQDTGTAGDQSATEISGAGAQIGHATGNLSLPNVDVSTKAYGVDLVVQRTYNHQNIQLQPVIGDTGWNNSPGPGDTSSYTSQWAFGFHFTTSFEQRLVSGDDGTDDGHPYALTFIDENGTNWPFTPTATSATTYSAPVGMSDWTLVKNPSSGTYPTCETGGVDSDYALQQKGGSIKCFDTKGRLLRETMRNGRSITYTRNVDGRVTEIAADDPDGAGSETPLKLTLSYNTDKRVSKITDQLGRETRYDYVAYSGMYYLNKVEKYADSGSSTALTRTDYTWDSNVNARRIIGIDQWIYADDPATGTSGDALKHQWTIAYSSANRVSTVTEVGTVARSVGTGSETIPAVADTITTMNYVNLTSGGTAATLQLSVKTGTAAVDDAFGQWTYKLDSFGRALDIIKPLEAGASIQADASASYTPDGRISSAQSDRGDIATYTYDASGNTTQAVVDHAASGVPDTITKFSSFTALGDPGKETDIRSPDGSFLAMWPYAANDCVDAGTGGTFIVTTAGTSASTAPTWPGSGAVTSGSVTFTKTTCTPSPQGVDTLRTYDSNGNEIQATDAQGVRTCTYYTVFGEIDVQYKLDGSNCPGSPSISARVKGTLIDNTYNAKGLLTQTDTDAATTRFTYDVAGQLTERRVVVDSADSTKDVVTSTIYDGAGRAARETWTEAGGSTRNTSTSYDMVGDPTVVIVPNAANPTGLSSGAPAGDALSHTYSAQGAEYLEQRADGTIITRKRDGRQRITFVSVPHAASNSSPAGTQLSYFLSGVKKTKTDPAGIVTTYDSSVTVPGADERPLKIDSPVAGTTTFTYNANGEQATKVTPAGTFSYGYDGNGNRAKTTYPNGDVLVLVRDSRSNIVQRRFTPSGGSAEATALTYRADDQPLTEDQASGIDTSNSYSTSTGQLQQADLAEDGGSGWTQQNRFAYDSAGRLASQILENGASDLETDYVYEDKSGRLKRLEQPSGVDERYVYDEQGRPTELKVVRRSDSSWQGGDTYAYDTQGRITTRTRREAAVSYPTTYTYDPAGQVTSETSVNGIVRGYEYRDANDPTAFGTDLARQVLYVTGAPSGSLTLARVNEIEACLTQTTSCGAADEAAIDAAIANFKAPGAILDPATQTSTAADVARWLKLRNNRLDWTASTVLGLGTCIAPSGWQNAHYEVTTAGTTGTSMPTWPSSGTVADGTIVWAKAACTPVLVLQSYLYEGSSPSKHQLVKSTDQLGTDTCYAYDSRGNQSYRGACPATGANQVWDTFGRPTQVVDDAGNTVTLTWYRDEYRLKSWVVAGTTRTLSYDSAGRIVRIIATGGSTWTTDFQYTNDGISAFKTGGTWYYLDRSKRGDVTGIRNGSGVLQAAIRYSAYGEIWSDNQALIDKLALTYNGREGVVTLAAGLYWMGRRDYSAVQARFIGADPVDATEGSLQAPYNYANGDPVNQSDPSGELASARCSWIFTSYGKHSNGYFYVSGLFQTGGTASSCTGHGCLTRSTTVQQGCSREMVSTPIRGSSFSFPTSVPCTLGYRYYFKGVIDAVTTAQGLATVENPVQYWLLGGCI